jgi:hypothetical protein
MKSFLFKLVLLIILLIVVAWLGVQIRHYNEQLWIVYLVLCLPFGMLARLWIDDASEGFVE